MLQKGILFAKNLKIRYKILLCILTITTIALAMISIMSLNYFTSVYEKDANEKARYTLDVASESFRNHIDIILRRTSVFTSSTPVLDTLKDIYFNNQADYISNYINVQDQLDWLIQSDPFINDVLLIGKNKEFFALNKYGLNYDVSNYFGWDIKTISKITLLPVCKNPLSRHKDIMPIIIPISQLSIGETILPMISGTVGNSIASIMILLDVDYIDDYFKELNKNSNSTLYIANDQGTPLNLDPASDLYSIGFSPSLTSHIKTAVDTSEFEIAMNNDNYLVASENVNYCDLKIVSIVSKTSLLSGIKTIKVFILSAWALSFVLATLLSYVLSQFITKPIVSLVEVVNQIKNGTYHTKKRNKYTDEVGILIRSINSMYETIELQIDVIKQEEQDKAKAELRLLEEQINPHFIYNTLDCIHWEILSNNTEASAAMVESLGEFLRISLNYGNSTIFLHQELKHAMEYVNIINHRSNHRIAFRHTVDDRLTDHKIVKLILQPLIENSIKHGFANEISSGIILSPYIEVNIGIKDDGDNDNGDRMIIEVSDNGRGIDIDKANQAMYQLAPQNEKVHVGLNNIYNRLRLYYGNSISIQFLTTPYYKNTIVLELPYVAGAGMQ